MWQDIDIPFVSFDNVPRKVADIDIGEIVMTSKLRDCSHVPLIFKGRSLFVQTKWMSVRFFPEHMQIFPDASLRAFLDELQRNLSNACDFKKLGEYPMLEYQDRLRFWEGNPPCQISAPAEPEEKNR